MEEDDWLSPKSNTLRKLQGRISGHVRDHPASCGPHEEHAAQPDLFGKWCLIDASGRIVPKPRQRRIKEGARRRPG